MIYKESGDKTIYKHAPGCGPRAARGSGHSYLHLSGRLGAGSCVLCFNCAISHISCLIIGSSRADINKNNKKGQLDMGREVEGESGPIHECD